MLAMPENYSDLRLSLKIELLTFLSGILRESYLLGICFLLIIYRHDFFRSTRSIRACLENCDFFGSSLLIIFRWRSLIFRTLREFDRTIWLLSVSYLCDYSPSLKERERRTSTGKSFKFFLLVKLLFKDPFGVFELILFMLIYSSELSEETDSDK